MAWARSTFEEMVPQQSARRAYVNRDPGRSQINGYLHQRAIFRSRAPSHDAREQAGNKPSARTFWFSHRPRRIGVSASFTQVIAAKRFMARVSDCMLPSRSLCVACPNRSAVRNRLRRLNSYDATAHSWRAGTANMRKRFTSSVS